jgi:hypothetical protein
MIDSNDKKSLTNFLDSIVYKKKDDFINTSEYRDNFDGERLYKSSL